MTLFQDVVIGASGGTVAADWCDIALAGPISGPGGLTKTGSGTLGLPGTYAGPVTVAGGQVQANPANLASAGWFTLCVGDDSGSHSEQWALTVGNNTCTNPTYGVVTSADFSYSVGDCYDITMQHLGTAPYYLVEYGGPNYDWHAAVFDACKRPLLDRRSLFDFRYPRRLGELPRPFAPTAHLGSHRRPELDRGKVAHLYIPDINIDTDSNNDGSIDHATDDPVEDQGPGRYVGIHQSGASDLAEADISSLFDVAPRPTRRLSRPSAR